MRDPDFAVDGWSLDDGEAYHRAAPETFEIPSRHTRESLQPGDYAKLIFRIDLFDDEEDPVSVERMWVLIRERLDGTYLGVLDNAPDAIEQNDALWLGTELPFRAEHVIDVIPRDQDSIDLASRPPRRAWPR